MKRSGWLLLLLTSTCFSAPPFTLAERFSGAWLNPETPGQGVLFEELDDPETGETVLSAYFFTYDSEGRSQFLVGQGKVTSDVVEMDVVQTSGGALGTDLDPAQIQSTPWGTFTVSRIDCSELEFAYASENGSQSGALNMVPLSAAVGLEPGVETCPYQQLVNEPEISLLACFDRGALGEVCNRPQFPFLVETSTSILTGASLQTQISLARFELTPVDAFITITDIEVEDSDISTIALIQSLDEGVIEPGRTEVFSLIAERTFGATERIVFSFRIDGIGTQFRYAVTLTTD